MGRDNSPWVRQKKQLERKLAQRASYDRILIVSEGSKTEPNYFTEIRSEYRLQTANVEVRRCDRGTAPIQVVEHARDLFEQGDRHRGIQPRAFEQVYAVFDRDDHESYTAALRQAEALNGKLRNDLKQPVKFVATASVPSFELWLLLHFEDVLAPIRRDEVLHRLKKRLPGYEKGANGIFKATRDLVGDATRRADHLAAQFTAYDDPQPYTAVVDLARLLMGLRG